MTNLSPAAQAMLDASNLYPCYDSRQIIAATLRAAADQFNSVEAMPGAPFCRNKLLAIATELEETQ